MIFAAPSPARPRLQDVILVRPGCAPLPDAALVQKVWSILWEEARRATEAVHQLPYAAVALTPTETLCFALGAVLRRTDCTARRAALATELRGVLHARKAFAFMFVGPSQPVTALAAKRLLVSRLETWEGAYSIAAAFDERHGLGCDFTPAEYESRIYATPFGGLLETH